MNVNKTHEGLCQSCGHREFDHRNAWNNALQSARLGTCKHVSYNPSTHEDVLCGCRTFQPAEPVLSSSSAGIPIAPVDPVDPVPPTTLAQARIAELEAEIARLNHLIDHGAKVADHELLFMERKATHLLAWLQSGEAMPIDAIAKHMFEIEAGRSAVESDQPWIATKQHALTEEREKREQEKRAAETAPSSDEPTPTPPKSEARPYQVVASGPPDVIAVWMDLTNAFRAAAFQRLSRRDQMRAVASACTLAGLAELVREIQAIERNHDNAHDADDDPF